LGIGDWGLGPIPNPQSPIPNPQSPIPKKFLKIILFYPIIILKNKILFIFEPNYINFEFKYFII